MNAMSEKQRLILLIMAVIGAFLCCYSLLLVRTADFLTISTSQPEPQSIPPTATTPPGPTPLQHRGAGAIVQCRMFIKDQLKAPSTAEFSNARAYGRTGKPANYHAVTGVVEAQNSLGVPIVSRYRCDVHYLPNRPLEWVLDNLTIE